MISGKPALGIRFDIGKIESVDYGTECWKVFWRAVDIGKVAGCELYEGDTRATLYSRENVYCLALQSADRSALERARAALEKDAGFEALAASPKFVEGVSVTGEPLPEAGRVDGDGKLVGGFNARSALAAVERERPAG